jgi:cytochrome c oxidase subunit 2
VLRSRHTVPLLVLAVVIGGATTAVALLIEWLPAQASEQAERVDTLMWFVVWASVVIFTLVVTVLVYSAFRFRAKPGDESDGPPIHGNTKLEILWTLVPTLLLAAMAVWAYLVLSDNEALASDRLVVDVTAEQFVWSFTYPGGQIASGDLRLPEGRQVELKMRSKDVIHDFYVKEFRVKEDVVPGITTQVIVNPNRTGTFQVICAELCGAGHSLMRSRVIVMEPSDYDAWLAQARTTVAAQAPPAQAPPAQGSTTAPEDSTTAPEDSTTAPAEDSTTAPPEGATTAP